MPRRPLTPENFPHVFTSIPPEQLRQFPDTPIAGLIPNRYYLYVNQIDTMYIIYVCNNYSGLRDIVVRYVYERSPIYDGDHWIESNMGTLRTRYDSFEHPKDKWYNLATGFDDANGRVQLHPDSVELLNCPPIIPLRGGRHSKKHRVRGMFAGRKTQCKRQRSTRRKRVARKTRKHVR